MGADHQISLWDGTAAEREMTAGLPVMKFVERGQISGDRIRANVRQANQVVGDIYSLVACNGAGRNAA